MSTSRTYKRSSHGIALFAIADVELVLRSSLKAFRTCCMASAYLSLSALQLSLSGCGGGGGSGPPGYAIAGAILNPSSVASGKAATSIITVTSLNGYTGSVGLSCSITTAGTPPPSCSLNPTTVTVVSGGSAAATLTVSTA